MTLNNVLWLQHQIHQVFLEVRLYGFATILIALTNNSRVVLSFLSLTIYGVFLNRNFPATCMGSGELC